MSTDNYNNNKLTNSMEYDFRKVDETNLGLDMNCTNVLDYADDLTGDYIRTIERNAN